MLLNLCHNMPKCSSNRAFICSRKLSTPDVCKHCCQCFSSMAPSPGDAPTKVRVPIGPKKSDKNGGKKGAEAINKDPRTPPHISISTPKSGATIAVEAISPIVSDGGAMSDVESEDPIETWRDEKCPFGMDDEKIGKSLAEQFVAMD